MIQVDQCIPIIYADSWLTEAQILKNGSPQIRCPISFTLYLLIVGMRKILVDAGCETMPGFDMRHFISPTQALKNHGFDAAEIDDLIITHAHHDHIEAVHRYPKAIVHIQRDEYEEGKRYIPDDMTVTCFDDSLVLADAVQVEKIAGHSVGSCVVKFTMGNKPYIICGDECYTNDCFRLYTPTGASCNPSKSQQFLNRYVDSPYTILYCHDPQNR